MKEVLEFEGVKVTMAENIDEGASSTCSQVWKGSSCSLLHFMHMYVYPTW